MALIPSIQDLGKIEDPQEFMRFASQLFSAIVGVVNGRLEFSNMSVQIVTHTFDFANQEYAIRHTLGRAAANYFQIKATAPGLLYDSGTAAQPGAIYLKSTVIATITMVIF